VDTGDPHHILCALPTGFGKTMPMLLLGHLLPPGAGAKLHFTGTEGMVFDIFINY